MKDICVISVETTGLDCFQDKILELAIVRLGEGSGISARFSSRVWPGEETFKLPGTIRMCNLLKRKVDDYRIAPFADEVAKLAGTFIGDWRTTQVASYNLQFERGFLQRKPWERIGKGYPWMISIMQRCADVMGHAGSPYCPWNEELKTYKWPRLIEAAHFFHVPYDPRKNHDALHKAEIAAMVVVALYELEDTSMMEDPSA